MLLSLCDCVSYFIHCLSFKKNSTLTMFIQGSVECGPSRQVAKRLSYTTDNDSAISRHLTETLVKKTRGRQSMLRQSVTSTDPSMLVHEIRKLEMLQRQLGEEATQALELLHKEVATNKAGVQDTTETIAKILSEIKDMHTVSFVPLEVEIKDKASLKEELTRLNSEESNISSLEEKLENVQKSIDRLVMCFSSGEETPECKSQSKKKKILPFNLSNTPNMPHIIRSPCSLSSRKILENETENRAPESNDSIRGSDAIQRLKVTPRKSHEGGHRVSSREATPSSRSNSVNVKKLQKMFKTAAEENIQSIKAYVTELKERVAKLQYQKQLLVCQVSCLTPYSSTVTICTFYTFIM